MTWPRSAWFPSWVTTGNPQSLQQKPLTFVRQVLSLVTNPLLLEKHSDLFPSDAVARAQVRSRGEGRTMAGRPRTHNQGAEMRVAGHVGAEVRVAGHVGAEVRVAGLGPDKIIHHLPSLPPY